MDEDMKIEEHLLKLPGEYRDRAIANMHVYAKRNKMDLNEQRAGNLASAIDYGFCWSQTPEKGSFWARLNELLYDDEDAPIEDYPAIPDVPIEKY